MSKPEKSLPQQAHFSLLVLPVRPQLEALQFRSPSPCIQHSRISVCNCMGHSMEQLHLARLAKWLGWRSQKAQARRGIHNQSTVVILCLFRIKLTGNSFKPSHKFGGIYICYLNLTSPPACHHSQEHLLQTKLLKRGSRNNGFIPGGGDVFFKLGACQIQRSFYVATITPDPTHSGQLANSPELHKHSLHPKQ